MANKKISQLDAYSGPNNPVGHIPITILGVTYKITPQQMFILSANILAALQGAASPSGSNVFATINDVAGFIPLTGTGVGAPISGDLQVPASDVADFKIYNDFIRLMFSANTGSLDSTDPVTGDISGVSVSPSSVVLGAFRVADSFEARVEMDVEGILIRAVGATAATFKGLYGSDYFGDNYTDKSYIQRQYFDDRGTVANGTGLPLSAADLDTAYPDAQDGFTVMCKNINLAYKKSDSAWYSFAITLVI